MLRGLAGACDSIQSTILSRLTKMPLTALFYARPNSGCRLSVAIRKRIQRDPYPTSLEREDDKLATDAGSLSPLAFGRPRSVIRLAVRKDAPAEVIGEILAGVVLGDALIGRLPFAAHFIESAKHQ